jgi:Tol biopolymer transport system component
MRRAVKGLALVALCITGLVAGKNVEFCAGRDRCPGKDSLIANFRILAQNGARPHWSPSGAVIVFDRRDVSGYAHLYLTDLQGHETSLTDGKREVGSGNSGNGIFDPSGKFIIFISEEPQHMLRNNRTLGDPGLGMFCNLWATTPDGSRFWRLTNIPIRKTISESVPVVGIVNPHFSADGSTLVWTERYGKGSGSWGLWRVRSAEFTVRNGVPSLQNERNLTDAGHGNYVSAMGFVSPHELVVAGNLDGQPEYGMDQYIIDLSMHRTTNLTNTPYLWEEGSCVTPVHHNIIYMTNQASPYKLDFHDPDWASQVLERDYWMMNSDGQHKTRLTYFNDRSAPEYLGGRNIVAACDVSPNGRTLAGTLGIDKGTGNKANMELKIVLIDFGERM